MATSRKNPLAAPPTPTLREELGELDAIPTEADDLQALMADLAGSSSSKITVYRAVKNQPLSYVFACTPDAFSLDDLRDRYNGGEFRLFISKDGALWKNKRICVEPKTAQQLGDPPPSATAELAAVMREGFTRQAEMMQALARTSIQQANGSPFAGIDLPATITALAAAVSALRPPPPPPAPPQSNPNSAIDMLLKGVELARDLKADVGGGGDEPSLMAVLRDLVRSPLLAQAVAAATPQRAPTRPLAPPAPPLALQPVAPALAPPNGFAGETSIPPPAPTMMTQYLAQLTRKAAEGGDPALYADLILDNIDADALQTLLNRPPSPVDALIGDYAPIAEYRDWFQAMVDVIAQALLESDPNQAQLSGFDKAPTDVAANSAIVVPGEHSTG